MNEYGGSRFSTRKSRSPAGYQRKTKKNDMGGNAGMPAETGRHAVLAVSASRPRNARRLLMDSLLRNTSEMGTWDRFFQGQRPKARNTLSPLLRTDLLPMGAKRIFAHASRPLFLRRWKIGRNENRRRRPSFLITRFPAISDENRPPLIFIPAPCPRLRFYTNAAHPSFRRHARQPVAVA